MRRVRPSARTGLDFVPPNKALFSGLKHGSSWCGRLLDATTYKRHKTCLAPQKSTSESTVLLMKETAENRRQWIKNERPTVQMILKEFPCLKDYKVVSKVMP